MAADRRRRIARASRAAAACAVITVGGGCAIQPDNAPREIPDAERGQLNPAPPGAGEAIGQSRIFLVAEDGSEGDRELRSVLRDVEPPTQEEVLRTLIAGANQIEIDAGMSSPLPPSTTLHSAPLVASTLNVDISPEILELAGSSLREAVAQIVFTGSELEGVRSVRIRVDGATRAWPDGSGELQQRPLTVYDYPGLAESAQPAYPPVPSENET
jgi:Sporulation and spore germination